MVRREKKQLYYYKNNRRWKYHKKNILLSLGNIFVCINALYVNDSFPELYSYTEESEFKFNREAFEKTLFSQGKVMLGKGVLFLVP